MSPEDVINEDTLRRHGISITLAISLFVAVAMGAWRLSAQDAQIKRNTEQAAKSEAAAKEQATEQRATVQRLQEQIAEVSAQQRETIAVLNALRDELRRRE